LRRRTRPPKAPSSYHLEHPAALAVAVIQEESLASILDLDSLHSILEQGGPVFPLHSFAAAIPA
jgi:hypothetical protein